MKRGYIVFIVVCLIMMLVPFAGMAVTSDHTPSESGEEIAFPKLRIQGEDGTEGINQNYLSDMGTYFTKNFAWRQELVYVNSWIYGKLFNQSVTDQVLLGSDGWMYYTNTLNDYTSTHLMTERGLNNVVHNIRLMQDFVEKSGGEFIFTIAPNKNSVYDMYMPYYYHRGVEDNNYERLVPKLESADIHYVNLHEAFAQQEEVLYLKQDSHWNNKGAVLVYNQIMKNTDLNYETYDDIPYEQRKDHVGDLAEMAYPLHYELEENQYYDKDWQYQYYGTVDSNMDDFITTTSPKSKEVLLMYRDSFGESLLPFFADEFGVAYFSRLVPYNLNELYTYKPDYVVLERVERRLSSFAEQAAIMQMPVVEKDIAGMDVVLDQDWHTVSEEGSITENGTSVSARKNGDYYQIDGTVADGLLKDTSNIYVTILTEDGMEITYETFWISKQTEDGVNDYGFSLYLLQNEIPDNISRLKVIVDK